MITRLIIGGIDVEILKEIPLSLNFAIADIRELSKRGGSGSKTVILSGTQAVNKVFENIFRTNIELGTFNPNIKEEVVYYLNEKEQIKGDAQLLKIIQKPTGALEYQCNVVARENTFMVAMGESLLTDLNYSDLDHTFNKTEQKNSWATTYRKSGVATAFSYGEGYVYPFINYGYSASDTIYDVNWFKPAIPLREYFLRIFASIGYTWNTGGFLDSAFFKHLYLPCNKDKIELSNSAISNSQYYIGKTTSGVSTLVSGSTTSNNALMISNADVFPNYDLESGPYFDASNQYDSVTTFESTIAFSGVYNIIAYTQLNATFNSAALPGGSWTSGVMNHRVYIEKNSGSGWITVASINNTQPTTTQAIGAYKSCKGNAQTGNITLNVGDKIRVFTRVNYGATLFDSLSNPAPNGTAFTIDYTIQNGTTNNATYLLRTDTATYDGNSLTMNNAIPINVKQKDLVSWVIQKFNLYIEKDKTNEKNLIIETRDAFYSNNVNDWTQKVDYSKDWEISPMGELDAISYIFKDKDDKDYYNDLYQKQYTTNYGQKKHIVTNDFIKSEKKIETGFSPTPLVSNSSNNIVCPKIYSKDGTVIKPLAHNIRILYYGGLKNSGNAWTYTSASGTTSELQYPFIGHVDDPLAPAIDLNFDFPNEVYYNYPLAYYTTNNCYNAYYSKFINEITDKNSKIITCSVRLTELDIMKFSFRNKVFIQHPEYGGTYYVVNKIIDYNPLVSETTKVELLKLKNYQAFVPDSLPIDIGSETMDTARIAYNPIINSYGNSETGNTLALGDSSRIAGVGNISTGGSGNYVDESSSRISLTNCNNVSVVGVTNFVGIGLSNRNIDSSFDNSTLDESERGNVKVKSLTVTGNFNIDKDISVYYVSVPGGGNITATFDLSTDADRIITFKRMDANPGFFKIDEVSGIATVDGGAIPYNTLLPQYGTLKLGNNGTDFFIL